MRTFILQLFFCSSSGLLLCGPSKIRLLMVKELYLNLTAMYSFAFTFSLCVTQLIFTTNLFKEADYALSSFVGSWLRYQKVGFSSSWYNGPFGLLVPYPKVKVDVAATLKPLSYEVSGSFLHKFNLLWYSKLPIQKRDI